MTQPLSLSRLLKNLVSYLSLSAPAETLPPRQPLPSGFASPPRAHSYDCHLPAGNYQNSCSSRVIPYQSSDPMIAPACHLNATCPTAFSGLAPVENSFFYPAGARITGVENSNGTLITPGAKTASLAEKPATLGQAQKLHPACPPPTGSYMKTCSITTEPYTSSDKMLHGSQLCTANVKCETLSTTQQHSQVYFADASTYMQIENCDGRPKTHPKDRCNGVNKSAIEQIAQEPAEVNSGLRIMP